jgi:NAD(P)-dependent dehydrogenase (short-subunit alcohol dehydrogenase family)
MGQFQTTPAHAPLPPRDPQVFPVHAGKGILVTGAAGGVGAATVDLLIRQGARVAAADVRGEALGKALEGIGARESVCLPLVFDGGDPGAIEKGVAAADAALGGLHAYVNCAAIVRHADPLEAPWRDWGEVFSVNAFGAFETSRLVAKAMIARSIGGAIVHVGSEAGKKGHKESLAYSASKASLISITRMLALSLAPHDINVNCVCPGGVATDMLREVALAYGARVAEPADAVFERLISDQLQRHIRPIEVARVISFLLSDDARLIRGQAINADGGDTPY